MLRKYSGTWKYSQSLATPVLRYNVHAVCIRSKNKGLEHIQNDHLKGFSSKFTQHQRSYVHYYQFYSCISLRHHVNNLFFCTRDKTKFRSQAMTGNQLVQRFKRAIYQAKLFHFKTDRLNRISWLPIVYSKEGNWAIMVWQHVADGNLLAFGGLNLGIRCLHKHSDYCDSCL